MDVGWRRNSLGRCALHKLVHIIELVEVDLAFGTRDLVVFRTYDHNSALRRVRAVDLRRDDFDGNVDMGETVEEGLEGRVDGNLHWLLLPLHVGWMWMWVWVGVSGCHGE